MATVLESIPGMSTAEKLAAMESLWSSLHEYFESNPPPEWHREILEQRMNQIESGESVYESWDDVKRQLRARIA
ncbi:MAG: addiction module protein [Akkermansiaceae bacterium]|jgi:hypothetical protein|nr:addiction module protein [Akkermansiaceae bacterium]MDP4722289.1 addiction module protein [Akkermansiaceae bacterium]MDP4780329.1 addiction module protein [Akkermansiaceae bacterium]MDP4846187.1 addiction module protein [Akkermansiaceae bacterium]MDP4898621.1 addiction module protein [Akkermansiaceae bacterium]